MAYDAGLAAMMRDGLADDTRRKFWLDMGLNYAASLPAK